jgi:hypothetical protein
MSDFQDVASRATDANRVRVSSDQPADTSIDRGARMSNLSGAQRATINTSGMQTTSPTSSTPGFTAKDTASASRITLSGGSETSTSDGFARATSASVEDREGVLSIRSPNGSPRSGKEIRPDTDLITVQGYTTTVAAALAMGVITRDGNGTYYNVDGQQLAQEEQRREEHRQEVSIKEPTVTALADAETEALVTEYASKVNATDAAMAIGKILDGEALSDDVVAKAATAMGVDNAQVHEHVNKMYQGFEAQARDVATETVLAWARANKLDSLRAAARDQALQGSVAGFQKLAAEYVKDLPSISPETILNSEDGRKLQARRERNGDITLQIGRGRVEWRAAIAAGLVAPKMVRK